MSDRPPLGVPLAVGRDSVIVSFALPYCVYLADGVYTLTTPAGPVDVQIEKRWRERDEEFSNAEIQDDPDGQYRYAKVRMAFTVGAGDDPQAIALDTINRLVDVYRFATGRAYLHPLRLHDLADLFIEKPATREGNVVYLFGSGGIGAAYPDDSPEVHAAVVDMLRSAEPVPLHAELALTAARLRLDGYTRQAVIDSVSALEVFVEGLLRERLGASRSEEEIDALLDQERLGDLMKKPMEDAIGWRPTEDAALWTDWIRVNGVRRRATHRGAVVSAEEADDAIAVVHRLIGALATRSQ